MILLNTSSYSVMAVSLYLHSKSDMGFFFQLINKITNISIEMNPN